MAYEVLITHDGYTDTAYSLCGDRRCAEVALECIGVPSDVLAGLDANDPGPDGIELDARTRVDVGILGETDSCEHCVTCGVFIRHGLVYPNDDVGCTHDPDADNPADLDRPHIDFDNAPAMLEYWGIASKG